MVRKLVVVGALIALVASGCSSDKSPSASDSTSTTAASGGSTTTTTSGESGPSTSAPSAPGIDHAFVINLENESFVDTWGANTQIPYLANDLRQRGVFLSNYYGIGHASLGNYIAQISGQGVDKSTQADCATFTDFVQTATADYQQAVGDGCVYPVAVTTIADQLTAASKTWKSYQEDMATAGVATCRHPVIGAVDPTLISGPGNLYATRHNPFVYFHSVIDGPECNNVVDLSTLTTDLKAVATTPNLAYITPNVCNDGHDEPCKDGRPGGMTQANDWLREWVPKILGSPAFQAGGVLIITFDEAELAGSAADSTACCGISSTPNAALPGISGPGGGRVGALVLGGSPQAGTDETPYNHYSLLCTLEEMFGLPKLGYAAHPETKCFAPKGGRSSALMP